jgi:hypothetical protein
MFNKTNRKRLPICHYINKSEPKSKTFSKIILQSDPLADPNISQSYFSTTWVMVEGIRFIGVILILPSTSDLRLVPDAEPRAVKASKLATTP